MAKIGLKLRRTKSHKPIGLFGIPTFKSSVPHLPRGIGRNRYHLMKLTVPNAILTAPTFKLIRGNSGVVVDHSSVQHETLFFTIADMAEFEIEDSKVSSSGGSGARRHCRVTHTHVNCNDIYKLLASKIKKKDKP